MLYQFLKELVFKSYTKHSWTWVKFILSGVICAHIYIHCQPNWHVMSNISEMSLQTTRIAAACRCTSPIKSSGRVFRLKTNIGGFRICTNRIKHDLYHMNQCSWVPLVINIHGSIGYRADNSKCNSTGSIFTMITLSTHKSISSRCHSSKPYQLNPSKEFCHLQTLKDRRHGVDRLEA